MRGVLPLVPSVFDGGNGVGGSVPLGQSQRRERGDSRGRIRGEPQRTARRLRTTTCGIARELPSKPRTVSEGGALAMTGRISS